MLIPIIVNRLTDLLLPGRQERLTAPVGNFTVTTPVLLNHLLAKVIKQEGPAAGSEAQVLLHLY